MRKLEGLPERTGWLRGDGPTELTIAEHHWRLTLDLAQGHKSGFYLDQRDNRARLAQLVRQFACREVLNCYSYTGGFSVAALAGGAAAVTSVDSSGPALARVQAHVAMNGFDPAASEVVEADVNRFLRAALDSGRRWDAIVLDPPKFAPTQIHADRAARAYKDINRLALQLLRPGGLLLTFSCSGGIAPDLFHKIVAGAAMDAGVDAAILARLEAAPDHAASLFFPEGDYLKGLVLRRRLATPASAIRTGAFSARGAWVKCASMAAAPARRPSSTSTPTASVVLRLTADQSENRPPTQSHSLKI